MTQQKFIEHLCARRSIESCVLRRALGVMSEASVPNLPPPGLCDRQQAAYCLRVTVKEV